MIATKKIIPAPDQSIANPEIYFGGDEAKVAEWPKNPDGDYLTLLFSIDCRAIQSKIKRSDIPDSGFIHVFSTYSRQEYFLDYITYSGNADELKLISGGYTFVIHSDAEQSIKSPIESMPRLNMTLIDYEIGESEFSMASLVSEIPPNGVLAAEALSEEYNFFCQIYSSDFPHPFQDALYLTDALGFLFIRKARHEGERLGLFFVQTA
ncbi:DUF1963 domain-containing protein [Fulvivirga kasyanovii]|uniref:DUF1963 domain-containing protein n=1 Tax=Fulvivirga kasyanovii TaxID=396812 RepID=A0ABW9RWP8_9BACT|nr:DUF1963 domain-containing protein [Fulvivirga kasyanovii]MTI28674.1 DUF1963 domain-containing protein [Fulvivirga kasyanovii]